MFSIAVAQTKNSLNVRENFQSITKALAEITDKNIHLILFPECALSGFSALMQKCTEEFLAEYLNEIQSWVNHNKTHVLLPTAVAKDGKVFNSVYWFQPGFERQQFFKTSLTSSEKGFFSVPDQATKKIITVGDLKFVILICREAQDKPWQHFKKGEADVILWPGYWGWVKNDLWTSVLSTGEPNTVLENMKTWQMPLIQANFAFNDLKDFKGPGPIGKSMVIDAHNQMMDQGAYHAEQVFVVELKKREEFVEVVNCFSLTDKVEHSIQASSLNLLG